MYFLRLNGITFDLFLTYKSLKQDVGLLCKYPTRISQITCLLHIFLQADSMNVEDEISVEDKVGPPVIESAPSQSGACDWPSSSSLTARLRRLITAYQRSYRQEQLKMEAEAKGDRRRRRCEQASKLKEIARQERQQRYIFLLRIRL